LVIFYFPFLPLFSLFFFRKKNLLKNQKKKKKEAEKEKKGFPISLPIAGKSFF